MLNVKEEYHIYTGENRNDQINLLHLEEVDEHTKRWKANKTKTDQDRYDHSCVCVDISTRTNWIYISIWYNELNKVSHALWFVLISIHIINYTSTNIVFVLFIFSSSTPYMIIIFHHSHNSPYCLFYCIAFSFMLFFLSLFLFSFLLRFYIVLGNM